MADRVATRLSIGTLLAGAVQALMLLGPAPLAAADPALPVDLEVRLKAVIRSEMGALRIPGLAVAVIRDGAVAYERGFGVADPSGRLVTPDTPFILGSTSKAITGIAVEQLVARGDVDLEASAQRYVPELAGATAWAGVRVRDLLSHTSGLPTSAGLAHWGLDGGPDDTLAVNAARLAGTPFDRAPGTSFEYSNANYDLLGRLVEAVTGEPFDRVVAERVLAPLGMSHSHTSLEAALADGLAQGYYPWFGLVPEPATLPYPRSALPSAMLISSAADLARLLLAELGVAGAVLAPGEMAATHQPLAMIDSTSGYAMGWVVHPAWPHLLPGQDASAPLPVMLEHRGDATVFHSYLALIPADRLGVALVMNTDDEFVPSRWDHLPDALLRILLGNDPLPPTTHEDALRANGHLVYLVLGLLVTGLVGLGLVAVARAGRWWRRGRSTVLVAAVTVIVIISLWLALAYAPGVADESLAVYLLTTPDAAVMTVVLVLAAAVWVVGAVLLSLRASRPPGLPATSPSD